MRKTKVTVIGGGFSGLVSAYYLDRAGCEVHVFEKTDRVGGLINTLSLSEGLVETAANGLLNSKLVEEFFQDLQVDLVPMQKNSRKRYFKHEALTQWPLGVFESLAFALRILRWLLFYKLLARKWAPRPGQFVFDYSAELWGRPFTEKIFSPALQGIFAASAERLSATLIYNSFFSKSKKARPQKGRGTVSAARGMGDLVQSLRRHLEKRGVHFHFLSEVQVLPDERPLVLACSLESTRKLLSQISPRFSTLAEKVPILPILTVTTFWKQKSQYKAGFGCLYGASASSHVLGVLFNEHIFPNRVSNATEVHSENWILGGARSPQIHLLSDSEIMSLLQLEHRKLWGVEGDLISSKITRWPQALPQYGKELETLLEQPFDLPRGVYLCGNYLGGIGLSKILQRAQDLAEEIINEKAN